MTKPMTFEQKNLVLDLSRRGYTCTQIKEILNMEHSLSCISKLVRKELGPTIRTWMTQEDAEFQKKYGLLPWQIPGFYSHKALCYSESQSESESEPGIKPSSTLKNLPKESSRSREASMAINQTKTASKASSKSDIVPKELSKSKANSKASTSKSGTDSKASTSKSNKHLKEFTAAYNKRIKAFANTSNKHSNPTLVKTKKGTNNKTQNQDFT